MRFINVTRLLAAFAVIMFGASVRADPVKVAIGHVTASDFTPLFVANEKGIFLKHNIDADLKRIPIITNIPPALVSGDLQIGAATMPVLLQTADAGLDITLIAGGSRHLRTNPKIALMVRKDVKVEKPADLKGKKIGVAGFNSMMDVLLRRWMKTHGVDPKDVTLIEAIFPQMPDLLKSGTLDAVTATDPIRSVIQKNGIGYVAAEYVAEVDPDLLTIGYISTGDWARKNVETVKNFRAVLDEANAFMKANPEEAKAIELKNLGFASETQADLSTAIRPTDLDIYISIGKEMGLYRTAIDPAKLIMP